MSDIVKGSTFTDGVANDVTAAKLHALVNSAVIQSSFISDKVNPTPITANSVVAYEPSGTRLVRHTIAQILALNTVSVGLTMPGIFAVGGSPVAGTGTLAVTLATQAANKLLAGPATGADAAPTFRLAVPADLNPASVAIAALDIDWALSHSFYKTLAANSTFTFTNLRDGQGIIVALTQAAAGGPYTVTWPTVKWSGGVAPTMTPTASRIDLYSFIRMNGITFGSPSQNFS